jgi:hypothetical protein
MFAVFATSAQTRTRAHLANSMTTIAAMPRRIARRTVKPFQLGAGRRK